MSSSVAAGRTMLGHGRLAFAIAWGFCVIFYFAQYALRSSPGVQNGER